MEIQCQQCHQPLSVTPEMAGYQVNCPHCSAPLVVPHPPGAQAPSAAMQQMQMMQQKKKGGCLKTALLVIASLAAIFFFFWLQDNKLRKHGIAQIEAMNLPADKQLMYFAIAKHYHNHSANSGERVSRKSTGTPSKAGYWADMKQRIDQEFTRIPEEPDFDAVRGEIYRSEGSMEHFRVELKADGTYKKTTHWDSDHNYSDANDTETGKWRADEEGFHWEPSGASAHTEEILRIGRWGFFLKESAAEVRFWTR